MFHSMVPKVCLLYELFIKQFVVDFDHRFGPPQPANHSLANRHSCSTSAETRDRKCFSMQLILVVGKVDMINQICQMLSFC